MSQSTRCSFDARMALGSLPLSNPSIYKIDPMAWMRPLSDVCDASWVKYYLHLVYLENEFSTVVTGK
jgi:hypothetical protein